MSCGAQAPCHRDFRRLGSGEALACFFDKLVAAAGFDRHDILYVGDRVDNDVLPAHRAGLRTAWIRRGPWGYVHESHPDLDVVHLRLESLGGLPDLIDVAA
jgi:FMN phosphatase YigB (HAD superfamily)